MHDRGSLRARHARHRHVEYDRSNAFVIGAKAIDGLDPVGREQDVEACAAQGARPEAQYCFFVIDEQHTWSWTCFGLIVGGRAALNSVRRSGHGVFLSQI